MTTAFVVDSISSLAAGLSEVIMTTKSVLATVLEVNHDAMSVLIQFVINFFSAVWAILNFIFIVIYTILVCIVDFLTELANFITAFLFLVWKLLILLYSFLNLVFHFIECAAIFLWTGGKWTAETLRVSGNNLTENGLGTWKYFVLSLKEFTNSVIGGFSTIGYFAKTVGLYICEGVWLTYYYFCECIYVVDIFVRDICRYIFDSVYYFFTDYLLKLPQEAYLGILVSCLMCLICKNIFQIMYSEGLTFPIWSRSSVPYDNESDVEDFENERRGEFSDDEDILDITVTDYADDETYLDDEYSVNSDISGSSDDDDSDDEDGELEVDSDSDNDSNAASESEMSEINIQLPDLNGQYDLRRSTTPSRFTRDMSSDDLQKVIETEKERRMCVVCQDRSKSVLILPCRHMCLCVECGNQIARSRSRERRKCPLCRTKINTIMNVYM